MTNRIRKLSLTASLLLAIQVGIPMSASAQTITATTKKEAVKEVMNAIDKRKASLELECTGEEPLYLYDEFETMLYRVSDYDDETRSDDGDYLLGVFKDAYMRMSGTTKRVTYILEFSYYESKVQTKKVNEKVKKILKEEGIVGKGRTPYEKVKAIHNYIIKKVSYDRTLKNRSAYDALYSKKTVCNGYAMLAYKMLMEAGVEAKFIPGKASNSSGSGDHAWNLVKIGDKWYNLDTTWDDWDIKGKVSYKYFLKGSNSFNKDHTPYEQYSTASFKKKYPISKKDYNKKNASKDLTLTKNSLKLKVTKKKLKEGKKMKISLKLPAISSTDDIAKITYSTENKNIATVSKKGVITAKKAGKVKVVTKVVLTNGIKKTLKTTITVKK